MRNVVLGMHESVTVPEDVTLNQLHDACARTGFSRFPVIDGAGDLTAYIHLKDILDIPEGQGDQPCTASGCVHWSPSRMSSRCVGPLATMQARDAHMARVADPHNGRLLGIATLEEVLEELVGDVVDAGTETR